MHEVCRNDLTHLPVCVVNNHSQYQVILGVMVYDKELNRGIRKKYLPEPNPQRVELARNATLSDVFQKAKELYFSEVETNTDSMSLADSGGILIPIDKDSWSLSLFYQKNHLQPSRYKLYVAVKEEVSQCSYMYYAYNKPR